MTKIKFCGLTRPSDIEAATRLNADYIGFVFAKKSRRCISAQRALELKKLLKNGTEAVGVFVDADIAEAAELLERGIIDIAQLHGSEDDAYVRELKERTHKPVIQAFRIRNPEDAKNAERSPADYVLLDSGAGTGTVFDWRYAKLVKRPYFLAGGLASWNAGAAVKLLRPFAVDVSSGIETEGAKDYEKMAAFAAAVRKEG